MVTLGFERTLILHQPLPRYSSLASTLPLQKVIGMRSLPLIGVIHFSDACSSPPHPLSHPVPTLLINSIPLATVK